MYTPLASPDVSPTHSDYDEGRTSSDEEETPEPPRKKQRIVKIKLPEYEEYQEEQNDQKILKESMTELIKMTESIQVNLESTSAELDAGGLKLWRKMEEIQNTIESCTKGIDHQNNLAKQHNEKLDEIFKLIWSMNSNQAAREIPDQARTFPVRIHQNRSANKPKVQCILCSKKNHKSADCRTIQFMAKRKLVLQRKRICSKCLKPGFDAFLGNHPGCPEPNKQCGKCQGDHHEDICDIIEFQAIDQLQN